MKFKVNIYWTVFCLLLFLVLGVLPMEVCLPDQPPCNYPDPKFDLGETFEPQNLCLTSQIRDNDRAEYSRASGSALTAVIDGDLNTYVIKKCVPDQWIEIQFEGASQWINFIQIKYVGGEDFDFAAFNAKGEKINITKLNEDRKEGLESTKIKTIEFDPIRAKGIRWSWRTTGSFNKEIRIYEISAWFYQPDPDPPIDPDVNDSINWLLLETGDGNIGPPDIKPFWNKILALPDWCHNEWHCCHKLEPPYDKAGDFMKTPPCGEDSHFPWRGMDYHDLSVVAVHGCPCKMLFTSGGGSCPRILEPGPYTDYCWGERDAEWFCALSCSPYGSDCPQKWAKAFNGLHLQCGFTTTAYSTKGAFLGAFADYMISTSSHDPALPVSLSWFLANARHMRDKTRQTCVIVMADDWRAYFDYLWGQGYVSPDPSVANGRLRGKVWWIWDPPFSEKESRNAEYPPPLTPEQLESIHEIESGPSSITFPARSPIGIPVKTTGDLDTFGSVVYMRRYIIHPRTVNQSTIQSMASQLCSSDLGILCNPTIGQDAQGNWWATKDEYALRGDPVHGVIELVNDTDYVAPKSSAPTIADTVDYNSASRDLLSMLGLAPTTGLYTDGNSYNIQTVYDLDLGQVVSDSSFDLSINYELYRTVDTFDLVGPGAHISVTWTGPYDDLQLQHFTVGGWHYLETSKAVDTCQSESLAIELLTTIGEQATIGGIPPECDTLEILSSRATYYNTNGEYETDRLEPVYHFSCIAKSAECGHVACDVYVPSRSDILRGAIDTPSNGSKFGLLDTVCFKGHATGGTPPYTFTWYSSVDDSIGNGDSVCTDSLSAFIMDSSQWLPHTITLTVTDAHGKTSNASISVLITSHGDANADGKINVNDVVYLINYLFMSGPPPIPLEAGDVNCDGKIDVKDVVYLINFLFVPGSPPPCDP
jgi:hypothetical protein